MSCDLVEWKIESSPIDYQEAVYFMQRKVDSISDGLQKELVWLLEHPALYTAGTGATVEDLLASNLLPVYSTNRGGKYTYHGPGQRIAYVMLNLKTRNKCNVRLYVKTLGDWIINTLSHFSIKSYFNPDLIGVWVTHNGIEKKIAAFGIRIRKWITYHGVSVNIYTDLSHYLGIVPCGIKEYGVTSFKQLGVNVSYEEFDIVLEKKFNEIFSSFN
ncbi:lipoyl(octanoyl) transferase LipB [Ehrlichia canis]|uniref:Octanoyltransferase n=1 Tax=Ehrlichia canis (strain Jake) TaxID=269484 RepID=LIPB_EHRCJ|nr:lipoyl(octanoyl) transferase LipB [Ehrlichia canis]Q3YRI1.1 RecName: Full=Octanoyltransferase; AltName: Full=Lipoate-protein ligase B; AltName: Full=Lipoyl/octanoyl transferase; AltName: Full=Octanoyl-[acyl-carrier-protein]-protein N-octanoyltransferase [Ehrlichia canis str. Jake]AAZ68674.1 Lipoate- protein ligase B [Ehrlichia canis str. Jake]AUO54595.1 lipoate-protein ligase B [Ehrlichia canis]UKC53539.1 lipB [Ehrlichia canis]UKC54477.1 lipB [Ehrlichia canis]UKC55413.1 lipB [Ehrlichia can